ncbi:gamma-glutamyltransferase [Pseudoflavonifractor phocaeensis]|uniref:gamma-glutamyltransferase n=1 Tax=Pseudoflavonifractor phocaeensis TaxID=1870988 RepID=UPI001F39BA07|nr:gamma-glutamyltransferase [Pseudoflavonifractor phocaeensis]MCF2597028.1 gamma-glutamyltransferase [Pseudoflavonifractor phocaeensis]
MKQRFFRLGALMLSLCITLTACGGPAASPAPSQSATSAQSGGSFDPDNIVLGGRDAEGKAGVVSSGRLEASQIGVEILQNGGNAIDAAVAMGFVLGVCEQQSSGIGGGGFMVVRFADSGEIVFIDFRDQSGAAASLDMWKIDENGRVADQANKVGANAVAVPGEVKGLLYALDTYGSMSRQEVMQPAIDMAREGFTVSAITERDISDAYGFLVQFDSTAEIYFDEDNLGMPYQEGDVITNPDLADTLQLIAEKGESEFYTGSIARKIVDSVQKHGGHLTMEDFANYEISVGEPVHGTYRGYDIYSSNLPSSGGTIIIEMLNILENFEVGSMDPEGAEYLHLLSETMKLGFADRTKYMGDPAYVDVPAAGLIDKEYAAALAASIDMTKSQTYNAGDPWPYESKDTTHYSIIDAAGNMVAVTKTVDATFASGLVAEGTGILLNDTLYDFSTDPESPNVVAGNKRPLSSMSPTLVLKDGEPFLSLGAPGTTRIITGVLQVVSKVIDHGMDIEEAIDAVRMHDDFGTLILENRVSDEVKTQLEALGHKLNTNERFFTFPCVQAVMRLPDGTLRGSADPRRDGYALGY